MYLINLHATPTKESDQYDTAKGAYVSIYIDYKDLEGSVELAKFYTQEEGWEVDDIEDDFYTINSKEDIEEEEIEFYEEAIEYGFAMIFNCYESDDED